MAYTTLNNVTSVSASSKDVIFDNTTDDGLGPLEWTITVDDAVDLYFTGIWPGADVPVSLVTGTTYTFGSPGRGVDKIEGVRTGGAGTTVVTLLPSVS